MKQGNKTKLKILTTANQLFYQQGYNNTSFSNIVDRTGLSKGNITYHFKSKQNILEGIVEMRLTDIQQLLNAWDEKISTPIKRLERFCDMLIDEQNNLQKYGCPMGTLTGELSKSQSELYQVSLPMFGLFRKWLKQQFLLLKFSTKQADENALELLSRAQGISVIIHAFKEQDFLVKAVNKLKRDIKSEYSSPLT